MLFCASRPSPLADHRRLNQPGAARPLGTGADVDRVQPLHERAVLFRARDEVHRLRRGIDRRRAGDADVAGEVDVGAARLADVGARHRHDAGRGIGVVDAPERRRRRLVVGVERVDAVVVRRDVDHVAQADAGDADAGDVERLRVDLIVDDALEQFAELADVHVGRRQQRFRGVRASACRVIVLRRHVRLRERTRGPEYQRQTQRRRRASERPWHDARFHQ